jgi:hypothetical protein
LDVARVKSLSRKKKGEECSYDNILVLFFVLSKTIDAKKFNISVAQPSPKFCYTTTKTTRT